MKQFTPQQKHSILLEYRPYSPTHSFSALAHRHGVNGGEGTVRLWYNKWNRTIASLQHKKGAGRPRILTATEVSRCIIIPIRRKNRAYLPVSYTKLLPSVIEKTGKELSVRTIRRNVKEMEGARKITGKKRTAEEYKYIHI
jgi:transposase